MYMQGLGRPWCWDGTKVETWLAFEIVGLNQITQVLDEVALLVVKRKGLPATPAL